MEVVGFLETALGFPGAWPDNPWDHEFPVVKVGEAPAAGKIFAFLGAETLGVKAGPNRDVADEWLDRFPDDATVMAYIGRSGWNTLRIDGAIPETDLVEALEASYRLVVLGLAKKHRPPGWETVAGS